MPAEREPGGEHGGEIPRASIDVEDAVAPVTLEVVVVGEIRGLVARGRAGHFHGDDHPGIAQEPERPIDGGEAEGRRGRTGGVEDLRGRQGTACTGDGILDRAALTGGAGWQGFGHAAGEGVSMA